MEPKHLYNTAEEWRAEAVRRFGSDPMQWRFKCPVCSVVTAVQEWKDAGAPEGAEAFSCIGRFNGQGKRAFGSAKEAKVPGPCNYTGGGLWSLNPVTIKDFNGGEVHVFQFAD